MRVLVVEDDADICECLQAVLEFSDIGVETVRDGQAALDLMRETDDHPLPDLILLDLVMPGMNGWEFRQHQLADPRLADIPTILVTAVDRDRAEADGVAMGCVVLRKPVRMDDLLDAIHSSGSELRRVVTTRAAGPNARRRW